MHPHGWVTMRTRLCAPPPSGLSGVKFCADSAKVLRVRLKTAELRRCVKVEVDVLGSRPSLINLRFLWT